MGKNELVEINDKLASRIAVLEQDLDDLIEVNSRILHQLELLSKSTVCITTSRYLFEIVRDFQRQYGLNEDWSLIEGDKNE